MVSENTHLNFAQVLYFRVYRDIAEEPQPARLRIFNNGLQQCPIKVDIVVADANGNPIPIPDDPTRRPQLIDFDTSEVLMPSAIPDPDPPFYWQYTETKRDYLWDESIVPVAADASHDAAIPTGHIAHSLSPQVLRQKKTFTYYVSTKLEGTKRIAARMRIPGTGVDVRTNSPVDDPENGSFNSSVIVTATPFPSLPIENYGVFGNDGMLLPHQIGNNDNFFFAREHYVHVSINGQKLLMRGVSGGPNGDLGPTFEIRSYRSGEGDAVRWAMSYYSLVMRNAIVVPTLYVQLYPWDERNRSDPYLSHIMYRECMGLETPGRSPYHVVIGLLMGNIKGSLLDHELIHAPNQERADFYILDAHGNTHALAIMFGEKLNQLRLLKA